MQKTTLASVIDGFLNELGVLSEEISSEKPLAVGIALKKILVKNQQMTRSLDEIRKIAFNAIK